MQKKLFKEYNFQSELFLKTVKVLHMLQNYQKTILKKCNIFEN